MAKRSITYHEVENHIEAHEDNGIKSLGYRDLDGVVLVYLIRSDNGLTKIGWTSNLKERLIALRFMSPEKLEVIGIIPTGLPRIIERNLHDYFQPLRKHGEWFELNDADVAFILSGDLWR